MEEQVFLKQLKGCWLGGSVVLSRTFPAMGVVLESHGHTHATDIPKSLTPVRSRLHQDLGECQWRTVVSCSVCEAEEIGLCLGVTATQHSDSTLLCRSVLS